LPQNPLPARYEYVDAESIVAAGPVTDCSDTRLDTVFQAHYARIARVIGRVIHDQARAEELAVEVILKWWRKSGSPDMQTESWLYRTAVREALDEWRRRARQSRFESLFTMFREAPPTPEHLYSEDVRRLRVRAVLSALSRRHSELLLLRSEGLSYRELAVALNINPGYIGSLLARAQADFRKEYTKRHGSQS
jgi:RNA polymerase sigma-70 factor (ECF subfamily)